MRTVLQQLGIPFTERSGWLNTKCPWCGGSKHKLGMSEQRPTVASCWRCGIHPLVASLVQLANKSAKEIGALLRGLTPVKALPKKQDKETGERCLFPPGTSKHPAPCHIKYLDGRGLTWKCCQQWDLRFVGLGVGGWQYRVILPIFDDAEIVAYQGRSISKQVEAKYLTSELGNSKANPKYLLFGEQFTYAAHKTVLITEGPFDAIKLGPGALALCGIGFTPEQVNRLSRYNNRLILFDNEPAAQERAKQMAGMLSAMDGKYVEVIRLPKQFKDAGELTLAQGAAVRAELGVG